MAYRESLDAANARIEALEHEIVALRTVADAAPEEVPDTRTTTARERELTRELERAHREIESLRHDVVGAGRPSARRPVPKPTPLVFTIGAIVAAAVVLGCSLFAD